MPDTTDTTSTPTENTETVESAFGPQVDVFAVHGVDPEVQAYAMAKYSRSSLSMKESLKELSTQKAEHFLNTFYFQYGHRSIADLAHIAMAVEKLSILAAIVLVDEQRWDGQERSTRYQNFKKSGYYIPDFGEDQAARQAYTECVDSLFSGYETLTQAMTTYYTQQVARPEEMAEDAYIRTLRARAFDNSRYLLPLATNTSLGQIVNARTLEGQISRLLSSPYPEVRHLGERLRNAAQRPAFNFQSEIITQLVKDVRAVSQKIGSQMEHHLVRPVRVAPTLVKYTSPSEYAIQSHKALAQAATEIMGGTAIESAPLVDLLEEEPLEVEMATTLLYSACHYSYRQIRARIQSLGAQRRDEIIDLGMRDRGRYDELLRAFHSGQQFRFDILMDIGGFRDMHRHRRCTQIEQGFTALHGYDVPPDIEAAGLKEQYEQSIRSALAVHDKIASTAGPEAALYVLPMAFRKRTLFKMDFAEALYISELRSAPAGHFSYRNVAYAMYEAVAKKHPSLARHFRVTDVRGESQDLLKR
jgi:thymidylate synthase ThyX